jgi:hypothetical protein
MVDIMPFDWSQHKKNMEIERKAWDFFEGKRETFREEMQMNIDIARAICETESEFKKKLASIKEVYRKKVKVAHEQYLAEVEKDFKRCI